MLIAVEPARFWPLTQDVELVCRGPSGALIAVAPVAPVVETKTETFAGIITDDPSAPPLIPSPAFGVSVALTPMVWMTTPPPEERAVAAGSVNTCDGLVTTN